MKIAGQVHVDLSREEAYDRMQDPEILAKAIPGCESLEKVGPDEYKLRMKMALASLSGQFEGKVKLSDQKRPESFRMTVEGKGKIGWMKGEGVLTLTEGTEVSYDGEAQVGGTMAAVGQRLIDTSARLLIKRFFDKLM